MVADPRVLPNCQAGERLFVTQMSDDFIKTFKRNTGHANDCVVNAMEVMGLMSPDSAAFLRFMKRVNKKSINTIQKSASGLGMQPDEVVGLLTICFPDRTFRLGGFKDESYKSKFVEAMKQLPNGHATIAFQAFKIKSKDLGKNGEYCECTKYTAHAFVVAKDLNGEFHLIDPQRFPEAPYMCTLNAQQCFAYVANSDILFVSIERRATAEEKKARASNGLIRQGMAQQYFNKEKKNSAKTLLSTLCRRQIQKKQTLGSKVRHLSKAQALSRANTPPVFKL